MVDSVGNILNQIGGNSSGINTRQLVNDLVALERAPQDQRLDNREARLEAQISGIGYLRSAMSALQSALLPLANPETFDAKQAAIPDTNLMAITKLGANAVPGNYRLRIEQVAQSHSLSSGTFESLSAPLGEGTLNLRLGSWTGEGEERSFSADESKAGATIEIDSSNNTLAGVRDAINAAGLGVQASIVGKDGNYQLLLTSPTGATNELEITVEETPGAEGLAAFASENLVEHQSGRDAIMKVNGFEVRRDSNTITDVIDGVEFDIFNAKPDEEININISADHSLAEAAIRDFVEAYNTFQTEMKEQAGFNVEEGTEGALRGDAMARGLMQSVRSMLGGAVPGIESGFNTLGNLGIRTQLDGTLQIVEDGSSTDFRAAMNNHFDQVRRLFVPMASSDDSRISVAGHTTRTQPGVYEVEITQAATRGYVQGGAISENNFPLDTTDKDYSFSIRVNGRDADISIPQDRVFESGEDLAAELQILINSDAGLRAARAAVNVSFDDGQLKFESTLYGRDSRVEFTAVSEDAAAGLGLAVDKGTVGTDVQGTINGEAGFGYGNVLRGAVGTRAEGLGLQITPGVDDFSATVNFSGGFGSNMATMMDSYLRTSGLLSEREQTVRDGLKDVDEARAAVDRRSDAFRARQEAQFRAMEQIVRSLNTTGGFLDGLVDRLPFTAPPR